MTKIERMRLAKGWTRGFFAAKAGVSERTVANIENGDGINRPPFRRTRGKIAKALGCDPADIFRQTGNAL